MDKKQLDIIEGDLQDRVMTLEKHGCMNRREGRARCQKINRGG